MADDAYRRLLGSLDRTGSDLATGNVQRLTRQGTSQAQFLARTFARGRERTHVTRMRSLLADRTAWNKLFRRSFWDAHGFRFPEGVVHEDIPVTLPAHLAARPRRRARRARLPVAAARGRRAVDHPAAARVGGAARPPRRRRARSRSTSASTGPPRSRTGTRRSVVADDLRLHLNLLDEADEAYRALFFTRVNALLDRASPRIFAALPAIDRVKWRLVRLGLRDELVALLRSEKAGAAAAPVRRRGRYRAAYPAPASVPRRRSGSAGATRISR